MTARLAGALAAAVLLAACTGGGEGPGEDGGAPPAVDVERVKGVVVQPDAAALSPAGDRLAVPCDGQLCVWDTVEGTLVGAWDGGAEVAWSPAGDFVATSSTTGGQASIVVLDASTGDLVRTTEAHPATIEQDATGGGITSLAFSEDGATIASAGDDGAVRQWSTTGGEPLAEADLGCSAPQALAYAPDGERLAVACADGPTEIVDSGSGERLTTVGDEAHGAIAWSVEGDLATASHAASGEATVRLWDGSDFAQTAAFPQPVAADELAFAPDGTQVAVTVKDERGVVVWSLENDGLRTLAGGSDPPRAVLWSPDAVTVYAVSGRDGVLAWNVETGELRRFEKPAE
ncbi:MAG: WD40 repeat domain-containing protein [Nocardioides sp.]